MNLQEPIDTKKYSTRLWWLIAASIAARFTAERSASEAFSGLLFWIVVLCLCGVARGSVHRDPARAERFGNVLVILGMLLFLLRLSTEGVLPALLAFLLAVQAAMFVTAHKRLHLWLILAAAFASVLFAAAETRSPLFLPCAAWFTLMALGLLALDHRTQREHSAALEPAATPERHTGGFAFASLALLLTIPVYLFVPKPGGLQLGGMQAKTAREYREASARSERPDPLPSSMSEREPQSPPESLDELVAEPPAESSGAIARPETGQYGEDFGISDVERGKGNANGIVLYARSSHPVNLRGRVYDRFADDRWSRSLAQGQVVELDRRGNLRLALTPAGPTAIEQSIEVVVDLDPTLLHAPGLHRLRFPAPTLLQFSDGVFEADMALAADTSYSIESRVALYEGRYVLQETPPASFSSYLDVDAVSQSVRDLTATVIAGSERPIDQALALEHHLRTEYQYTYETIPQQNYTPLDWFLFDSKRGHCEYFASALAMMLRTIGIPSRVATGFSLGDPDPITGWYEVRAHDGHAWVEAYIDGQGWVMLEPTPFYPLPHPRVERQVAEQMDGYLERLAQTRELLEPGTVKTQLTLLARDSWRTLRFALDALMNWVRELGWLVPIGFAVLIAATLMLYLLAVAAADWLDNARVRRALDSLPMTDPRAATLTLAEALVNATSSRSLARREDWTLREYAERLSQHKAAIPEEFVDAFDAARYDSTKSEVAPATLTRVAALIRRRIRENPWPRLQVALTRLKLRTDPSSKPQAPR